MTSLPTEPRALLSRSRVLFYILILLTVTCWRAPSQTSPSSSVPLTPAMRAHFVAAQQAERQSDYVTAEREYGAVLAEAPNFAEAHLNLGLIYQLQNRTPEAVAEFRRALGIKPALAGANFFLGVDYCKSGEGTKAIPYLRAASRQEPNRTEIWSWLATAQEISGDLRGEIMTLKHALGQQPQNVDLLYLLGHAYERMGKDEVMNLENRAPGSSWSEQLLADSYSSSSEWSFAIIRFQNALAISANRPGLHVGMGEVFLRVGRLNEAGQEFEQELRVDAHSLRALVRRGEVRLIQSDVAGALEDWARATSMDMPRAEIVLGIHETGFGDAALEQLPGAWRERVLALAPQIRAGQDAAARLARGFLAVESRTSTAGSGATLPETSSARNPAVSISNTCLRATVRDALNEGRFSSVSACLLKVLTPQSAADFRMRIAQALFELGDYESSLRALGGLSSGPGHSAPALYWRARSFEKLATAAYLRLYHADPNSYRVHQLLGDLEAAKNNDPGAIEEYRVAVAMRPSLPNLHYSLGHVLWKELKMAEARMEFEAELALNQRHSGALHDLGNTYLLEHQPEQALAYLRRALEVDPDDPDLHRDLGTAYADLQDYSKAQAEFKTALPGDHDGSVHYQLARVYQALGQKQDAAREFTISTSLHRQSHAKLEKQTERINQIEVGAEHP